MKIYFLQLFNTNKNKNKNKKPHTISQAFKPISIMKDEQIKVNTNPMEKQDEQNVYMRTDGGNAAFHNFINDFSHIKDPLERRRLALEKIDNAKFGWYHIRAILVAGVGFLTDSYDIFAINLAITMMTPVFFPKGLTYGMETFLKVSTSVGAVIGQVGFGILGDVLGRKGVYGFELIIVIFATIVQCCLGVAAGLNFGFLLGFWRIIMGVGIGGDYPLSSVITSEFATTRWRGAIMSAVFANQAWGQLAGGILAVILVEAYKNEIDVPKAQCEHKCLKALDQMWRILVGFGAVPGCVALYFRLTIPESPRYTLDCENQINQGAAEVSRYLAGELGDAENDEMNVLNRTGTQMDAIDTHQPKASWKAFWGHFGQWKYGKILFGTAFSWFFLDVAFYGLGLNTSSILKAINYTKKGTLYESLSTTAKGNLILLAAGSLPGYWFSIALIDTYMGRRSIQLMGFVLLTVIFAVLSGCASKNANVTDKFLFFLYVMAEFFCNFGPNTTTFVTPGEIFPTAYKSTAHGLSAGWGKVGAIFSQCVIGKFLGGEENGVTKAMGVYAGIMVLGIFTTLLVPETKGMTLEEISVKYHDTVDPNLFIEQSSTGTETDEEAQV